MEISNFLDKGGLLVWPIILCSIIGTTIFFERLTLYRKIQNYFSHESDLRKLLLEGKFDQVKKYLQSDIAKFSADKRMLLEAIDLPNSDREIMEMVVVHGVSREVANLSRTLGTLAILASVCPLLGLLGTVIGMIKAFMVVETMGGSVNAAVLAGGIWEAMLTTAFGLIAAIPLLFYHNHLENRLHLIQAELEEVAICFVKTWSRMNNNVQVV